MSVSAIRGARVFDGSSVHDGLTVTIRDGIIERVASEPADPTLPIIDASGMTLLPGLIESHCHVGEGALEQMLSFGVTTALDMFARHEWVAERRAEQARGDVYHRADLFSAGTLITCPGGHGTQFGVDVPTITEPSAAEGFVDAVLAEGSDYIKVIYGELPAPFEGPSIDRATLEAVVRAGRARGRLVIVHAQLHEGAEDAVRAGASGLAHLFADREATAGFLDEIKERGVFVITTLCWISGVSARPGGEEFANDPDIAAYLSEAQRASVARRTDEPLPLFRWDAAVPTLHALLDRGIPVLAGSDSPIPSTAHGAGLLRELELLIEAGVTPVAALAAATATPAEIFGLTDRGRIEPGRRADLILTDGDPTSDIKHLRRIRTTWKAGRRHDLRSGPDGPV